MAYKLGSLFDGSGGFPLAGALCGIEPLWASEVEPYPIAVTRERFPNMKHLGDISKIHGGEIEPVDIITFGSPCQDLSVAGKRAGLKHEANGDEETTRSGLFMEAVRIIKEMREATNGKYPRFALWENVPGAFSSNKGEDFRIVCEELIKIVEPSASMPSVPKGGWSYADSYVGDGWSLAYRVFDAQYWGVPQRRRRIHLVADFSGQCAREVLFEREGVRGYFAEGRTPWQATPADAQGGPGADDREGEGFDGYNGDLTGGVSSTLGVNCGVSTGRNGVVERVRQLDAVTGIVLDDQGGQQINVRTDGKAPTLRAETHGNLPCVMEYVTYALDQQGGKGGANYAEEVMPTLCSDSHGTPHAVAVPYTLKIRSGCEGGGKGALIQEDKSATLATNNDQYLFQPVTAYGFDPQADRDVGKYVHEDIANTLVNGSCPGYKNGVAYSVDEKKGGKLVQVQYIVRRLTPTECARLQGFADWWGIVEQKDRLTDEEYQFWLEVRNTHAAINGKKVQDYTEKQMLTWYNKLYTDSAEYKMWGNGIALPPALYCMQGIVDALMSTATAPIEEAEVTDLSNAPANVKETVLANAELLEAVEQTAPAKTSPVKVKVAVSREALIKRREARKRKA